jgi:hypothetical protein
MCNKGPRSQEVSARAVLQVQPAASTASFTHTGDV